MRMGERNRPLRRSNHLGHASTPRARTVGRRGNPKNVAALSRAAMRLTLLRCGQISRACWHQRKKSRARGYTVYPYSMSGNVHRHRVSTAGRARSRVYLDTDRAELPVRLRGGAIGFYRWGARRATYYVSDNVPGWGAKFPETEWVSLEEIRAGKWAWLEPRPVRILAARFLQVDSWGVSRHEFIQGLLAHITPHHYRVYVVTVPLPAEHAAEQWQWPRIVLPSGGRPTRM